MGSKTKVASECTGGTRTKRKTKDQEKKVKKLLEGLPRMSLLEVRRNRMEYYKALCCELDEDGFSESSKFLEEIIHFVDEGTKAVGPDSALWYKPKLKDQNDMLDTLRTGLQQAEEKEREGQLGVACSVYLNLALYFEDKGENWYHVADVFFRTSYQIGDKYKIDGQRSGTIARYAYGKFLMEKMNNDKKAHHLLESARLSSIGKSWILPDFKVIDANKGPPLKVDKSASEDENDKIEDDGKGSPASDGPSSVHQETCILLQMLLSRMAKRLRERGKAADLELAIKLSKSSLKRAVESKRTSAEAEAIKDLGLSYVEKGDMKSAVTYFTLLHKISSTYMLLTGICEAHEQLGHAYTKLKDPILALYHYDEFCKAAQSFKADHLLGRAYRCLGVYHLINENHREAASHLEKAFLEYHALKERQGEANKGMLYRIKEMKRALDRSLAKKDAKGKSSADARKLTVEYERSKKKEKDLYNPAIGMELEQTRVLAAIAKGFKYLPLYADIVTNSSVNRECMGILLEWRGCGSPFWRTSFPQELPQNLYKEEYVIRSSTVGEISAILPEAESSSSGDENTDYSSDDGGSFYYTQHTDRSKNSTTVE